MPPKAKFTKEEIIEAALDIVRTEGAGALTARALGTKLGSSARPIFTVFQSMEEVQQEVIAAVRLLYADYVERGLCQEEIPAFKGVGMQYIQFAITEPKLFQILFMTEQPQKPTVRNVLPVIDDHYPQILSSVQGLYSLDRLDSEWLYRHLWVYTHGIAVLCATNMCTFSPEEIGVMLTEVCTAMLKEIKEGNRND
ncbi:MAG: TetR/AcrR family transcriptional regulator [Coprococcus sp.]|nr:TetR/AcrR family transcriptional regulator [Coprococcus sp.]